jgi:hypothetical protein
VCGPRVAAGHPVHLVRPDPGLVLAVEQALVALAEKLERALGDEAVLQDEEAVALERADLLGGERLHHVAGEGEASLAPTRA